jgi:MoaA/NifB/PqqE/SkfB family radical SAM enzyme
MPTADPAELTTSQGLALIDQIASFGTPPPLFVLTGGDPLKRRDLAALVRHAVSSGLPTSLSPSATPLLTEQAMAELRAAGLVAISLSLDGANAQSHDAFRGREKTFARTIEAWDRAHSLGLKVQVNTTVTTRNLHDLAALARIVLERRAMTWSVFFLVQTGRGTGLEQISASQCEDAMNFLYDVGAIIPLKTTCGNAARYHRAGRNCARASIQVRRNLSKPARGVWSDSTDRTTAAATARYQRGARLRFHLSHR